VISLFPHEGRAVFQRFVPDKLLLRVSCSLQMKRTDKER
jgi:hypothetical protein